ncbi:MAG: MarR family winged helix-turn-helix transcriptional regulator [Leuconostoc gelidum]|mgnify:FL=1|jgi:DNA-binding MarR family transcriptional regulator|uniref:Winged helix-turn-helix transcriptional regulator n=1 Tax=Leuconostoc gelidum subsp. gelidum TaxID=1607839 RepID=A0AB35G182_LEUGE|nr:MarR family winged helix-turn-helix transcriptional regulator [Leuconostoc gelidum]MBR2277487.1 winged helix-turn-helix transcriptional regulator [Leuconostoc sp.]MBZ5964546.1 winged helix-turn-helix transcriptional regulator [Leuconostoc gelidum subsp. gelidum]MBZ5974849.1 winged helix-turn-helix transcriptional regulator [Leuconostoc gelidum subsp. gelidum]MBZ5977689.1 winged helix-turn-helix transcriptional regulator [Leuconostoc gelidum subsp. gelidum]MBZ5977804.1 winged helix-turn-heli
MANSDLMAEFISVYMSSLKNLEKLISQPTSQFGISFEQWLIMTAVVKSDQDRPLTMTKIATERGVTKGAIARQLKPLFEQGYLNQVRDEQDNRRILLNATLEGQRVESIITRRVNSRFNGWLDTYGLVEGQALLSTLRRLDALIVQPELNKEKH